MNKDIIIPSMKHRPICLIVFKPNKISSETRKEVHDLVMSVLSANEITKKTFDRLSHFTKDERFLYIPMKENTRKFLKYQVENDWLREKPQMVIDPTVGVFDTLAYKSHICIRLLTNNMIQHMDISLAKSIASLLSDYGTAYVLFHDRKPTTDRSQDFEYFLEVLRKTVVTEWQTGRFNDMRVFDKVLEVYNISIRDIVEELDMGVEIMCAPYDIKEYYTRISEIDMVINANSGETKLSEEDGDDIRSELEADKQTLMALIQRTNEMIVYRKVAIETVYFKMDQLVFDKIKQSNNRRL